MMLHPITHSLLYLDILDQGYLRGMYSSDHCFELSILVLSVSVLFHDMQDFLFLF